MEQKYKHLIKPLKIRMGPPELYTNERFWMEGKDLEGFNFHWSYGFIKEPGIYHPTKGEKMVVHPYDEVLLFTSSDPSRELQDLGAEVSIELGEENEEQILWESSVVVIPKGMPHGPVKVMNLEKPIVHYLVGLGPEYKAELVSKKAVEAQVGTKYISLIKSFRMARIFANKRDARFDKSAEIRSGLNMGPGEFDRIVWFFGENLEGLPLNISWDVHSHPGLWHILVREGGLGGHTHPADEVLFVVGLDPERLEYLGCQIEIGLGEEDERHYMEKPSAICAPKNFLHCPVVTLTVQKTYGFIVVCLSADHETKWFKLKG